MDLFDKAWKFTRADDLRKNDIYAYFLPIGTPQDPEIELKGKRMIMVGSNNYLGLANDPRMKQAAHEAIDAYGTGCTGSRFLNGTFEVHEQLEEKLTKFKGWGQALVFSTGYQANVGVVSCLVGRNDVVLLDKFDHASIVDGARLSNGQTLRFKHSDVADLERLLKSIPDSKGKFVVVDGVFSMEGDIAPLPDICKVAKKYGARVMVDDAHATGVLGTRGTGSMEHFGLTHDDVDLVFGTCSKSFASVGGFVIGDPKVIDYVKHLARSMMFSAALPPVNVATISKAIDIIEAEPERRLRLWENAERLRKGFRDLGFDTGISDTPIVPVIVGSDEMTCTFWKILMEQGIFTTSVLSPAVPPGEGMIRCSLMATHTDEQIDRVLNAFEFAGRKLGIIQGEKVAA